MGRRTSRRKLLLQGGSVLALMAAGSVALEDSGELEREGVRFQQASNPNRANNVAHGPPDERRPIDVSEASVPTPDGEHEKWVYNGEFPVPTIRVPAGSSFESTVQNDLDRPTTVHWHGVPVPNGMDGVPNVTQEPIGAGDSFTYNYRAEPAGTYLYHSHVGVQSDWALMGPLIFEERNPHADYDGEFVVMLNDFRMKRPDKGDAQFPSMPDYDSLNVNGHAREDPATFDVAGGNRYRFRILNGSGATTYNVSLAGHEMQVAWTDGRPVEPEPVDSLDIGVAERYDVIVETDNDGRWELRAAPVNGDDVGNPMPGRAVVQYNGHGDETLQTVHETGSGNGKHLAYQDLSAVEPYDGISGSPDRTYRLELSRGPKDGSWAINDQIYPNADPLEVASGEHVRFRMHNTSDMYHPMHLHGHFFKVQGVTMDTVLVPPHSERTIDFYTDNPGNWFFHCHIDYHRESGMARVVEYQDA
jgi:FtsP/CotA-like multicopper oxidase with cupredoxin domain